ncbi:hypothetical protein M404DRAFT_36661, partial [Pisolithus tinctorius Marx 270]
MSTSHNPENTAKPDDHSHLSNVDEEERLAMQKAIEGIRQRFEARRREREEQERREREKAEAERLEREKAEAERLERERAEAERLERERAEVERQEREERERRESEVRVGAGRSDKGKGRECERAEVPCTFKKAQKSKRNKRTCDRCTEQKVRCELPEGASAEVEEQVKRPVVEIKTKKKRAAGDETSPRGGEKKKVMKTTAEPSPTPQAGPSVTASTTITPIDPITAAVARGFEALAAAINRQTEEMRRGRETQHRVTQRLEELLGECQYAPPPRMPSPESSE